MLARELYSRTRFIASHGKAARDFRTPALAKLSLHVSFATQSWDTSFLNGSLAALDQQSGCNCIKNVNTSALVGVGPG